MLRTQPPELGARRERRHDLLILGHLVRRLDRGERRARGDLNLVAQILVIRDVGPGEGEWQLKRRATRRPLQCRRRRERVAVEDAEVDEVRGGAHQTVSAHGDHARLEVTLDAGVERDSLGRPWDIDLPHPRVDGERRVRRFLEDVVDRPGYCAPRERDRFPRVEPGRVLRWVESRRARHSGAGPRDDEAPWGRPGSRFEGGAHRLDAPEVRAIRQAADDVARCGRADQQLGIPLDHGREVRRQADLPVVAADSCRVASHRPGNCKRDRDLRAARRSRRRRRRRWDSSHLAADGQGDDDARRQEPRPPPKPPSRDGNPQSPGPVSAIALIDHRFNLSVTPGLAACGAGRSQQHQRLSLARVTPLEYWTFVVGLLDAWGYRNPASFDEPTRAGPATRVAGSAAGGAVNVSRQRSRARTCSVTWRRRHARSRPRLR